MALRSEALGHGRADRTRQRAARLLGHIGGALGILLPVAFAGLVAAPARVDAALPAACSASTVFNLAGLPAGGSSANAGNIYALNVTTGQNTMIGRFGSGDGVGLNGLAVAPDLSAAYAVTQTNGTAIWTHTQSGANSSVAAPSTGMTMVMGAVDPVTGIYYYAGYTGSGATLTLAIFGYNPATNTPLGRLVNVSMAGTGFSTGDIAFDASGNLFIVAGTYNAVGSNTSQIRRVDGPLPTTSGGAVTLPSTTLATNTAPAGSGFYNGIAFAADGTLLAQYATTGTATLVDLNPNTGAVIRTVPQTGVPGGTILADLAGCSLPGTLTVQKDLPAGRATADDQFTMTVTGGGITEGNTSTTTGTATGIQDERVGPLPAIPSTTYTISESLAEGTTTSINAYTSSWSCRDTNPGSTFSSSGTGTGFTVTFPSPDSTVLGATVVCTFTNTPVAPTVTLTKALGGPGRVLDTDQFTMQLRTGSAAGPIVGTTGNATTTGTGTTVTNGTGTTTLAPATANTTYFLTDAAAGTTNPANYRQDIECTDDHGVQTGLPDGAFTGSATVTPVAGAAISCTLTNTPPTEPVLQLEKQLGSDRVRDTDQFTVGIRPDSPSGTPLPPVGTDNPTTAGTGAIVDHGTGITGFTPLTVGRAFFLTETAAGDPPTNLGLYSATVTCEDHAGLQTTGLPVNVPLSDDPSVTPINTASRISCVITNTANQPTLTLHKALGGARVNAGDQFTVQIRASDQTTVLGSTTGATTDGAGDTVTPGTGTTTLSPATAGDAFYLGDVPATGTPTDLRQYSATITCTDANGVQTGLPTDESHAGLFEIAPQPGAQISCTVTNTPIRPGLQLDKALGSARLRDTDQFTMQIKNPTGTVVGTTADATTTGTGSTVDAGTGTTLLFPATAGTTYTVTDVGAGTTDLADYAATITCSDTEELQPALPTNAAFTGSITITPVAGASISCTVTNTAVVGVSRLGLTKTAHVTDTNHNGRTDQGDIIHWTLTVTNLGTTTLNDISVSDSIAGPPTCPFTTLTPGQSMTCTVPDHTITAADANAGHVTNTATATGTDPRGELVTSGPVSTTTPVRQSTLPVTGQDLVGLMVTGGVATLVGLILVLLSRVRRNPRLAG